MITTLVVEKFLADMGAYLLPLGLNKEPVYLPELGYSELMMKKIIDKRGPKKDWKDDWSLMFWTRATLKQPQDQPRKLEIQDPNRYKLDSKIWNARRVSVPLSLNLVSPSTNTLEELEEYIMMKDWSSSEVVAKVHRELRGSSADVDVLHSKIKCTGLEFTVGEKVWLGANGKGVLPAPLVEKGEYFVSEISSGWLKLVTKVLPEVPNRDLVETPISVDGKRYEWIDDPNVTVKPVVLTDVGSGKFFLAGDMGYQYQIRQIELTGMNPAGTTSETGTVSILECEVDLEYTLVLPTNKTLGLLTTVERELLWTME